MATSLGRNTIGARIRAQRRRTGKPQTVVAGLAGISGDYLGQIERGRRTPSLPVVRAIAAALGIPAGVLLGEAEPETSVTTTTTAGQAVARALVGTEGGEVIDVGDLAGRVERAWQIWQYSSHRYSELLPQLPVLIADVEATVHAHREGSGRRRATVVACELYGLLRTVTRRIGRVDLSFLIAERGMRAAEDTDDPVRIAVASWNLGHTLLVAGEYEAASEVADTAATRVVAQAGQTAAAAAMSGALSLVAAMADAHRRCVWQARDRLNRVYPLAASAGGTEIGHTMFSDLNVALHAVAVELHVGEATEAVRVASKLDGVDSLSMERRFTLSLDLARACELLREDTGTLLHLSEAQQLAPEDFHYNQQARDMVERLIGASRIPRSSTTLAALAAGIEGAL